MSEMTLPIVEVLPHTAWYHLIIFPECLSLPQASHFAFPSVAWLDCPLDSVGSSRLLGTRSGGSRGDEDNSVGPRVLFTWIGEDGVDDLRGRR